MNILFLGNWALCKQSKCRGPSVRALARNYELQKFDRWAVYAKGYITCSAHAFAVSLMQTYLYTGDPATRAKQFRYLFWVPILYHASLWAMNASLLPSAQQMLLTIFTWLSCLKWQIDRQTPHSLEKVRISDRDFVESLSGYRKSHCDQGSSMHGI